ncbi:MAG: HEPN domain-containing protein [Cyanobacteria bacterium J06628_6]
MADQEIETAQLLLSNDRHRACISRAYYAMYYATQALLRAKKIASRTHKGMIQQFGQHFVKTGEFPSKTAKELSDNYNLRQLSDYEETIAVNEAQAAQALETAVRFVEQVRVYLNENDRT